MEFALGGIASCGAVVFTNPLEVVKTRFQLQGELQARTQYTKTYRNVVHAVYTVARNDGILGLQKGLTPALGYQFGINAVKRGTYQAFVTAGFVHSSRDGSFSTAASLVAGAVSGCAAACVGSPLFMIKTQLQSSASTQIAVGFQHNHSGFCSAVKSIYGQHGVQGLWRGWSGLCARLVFSSMAELTVFMKLKVFLHNQQIFPPGSLMNSAVSSCLTSLAVVIAMTPFDVMATRLYNQPVDANGKGILYRHLLDCAYKIIRQEGPLALYKGVTASACRVAPHVFLSLFFWDKLRTAAGLDDVVKRRGGAKQLEDNLHEMKVPQLVSVPNGGPLIFLEKVAQGAGEHLDYTQPF